MLLVITLLTVLCAVATASTVSISNTNPRLDTDGNIIDIHDGNIVQWNKNDEYFYYGMGYGLCKEPSGSNGCSSMNTTGCGFQYNHSVNLYTSKNLSVWEFHGNVLPLNNRPYGIYFSPSVVFNPNTKKYVLMAHYLPNTSFSSSIYMSAISDSPYGPFITMNDNVNLTNSWPGDSKLFVDDDNKGYLIYDSNGHKYRETVIELLTDDYLYSAGQKSKVFNTTICLESPTMFKHIENGLYYAFTSFCCCYCQHGGNVIVWISENVLGPYNQTEPWINSNNGNNNNNLIINAQQTNVFLIQTQTSYQYIWIGDRWQSSPDDTKAHDFTYWAPLKWNNNTSVQTMKWYDNFTIVIS